MTYRIDQKIGKYIYVYEVQSYWDSQKKQARQKQKYISKKDSITGKISTPRKGFTPRIVRDYGHIYLLFNLANRIGLTKVLKEVFSELSEEILYLCFGILQALEVTDKDFFKHYYR